MGARNQRHALLKLVLSAWRRAGATAVSCCWLASLLCAAAADKTETKRPPAAANRSPDTRNPMQQPFQPPVYTIRRASRPPTIDGKLDDAVWAQADEISRFVFPWHKSG